MSPATSAIVFGLTFLFAIAIFLPSLFLNVIAVMCIAGMLLPLLYTSVVTTIHYYAGRRQQAKIMYFSSLSISLAVLAITMTIQNPRWLVATAYFWKNGSLAVLNQPLLSPEVLGYLFISTLPMLAGLATYKALSHQAHKKSAL